ncbi:hypothetical protein [Corynebacterium fournieri]|uniref:hypothetical protein n=1 Tax=Corynebacterium fournieri TaxID=1852390 RepID=UPI000A2F29E0|nr:hypothetical protein [Corynebacterium fournieri]WJY98273.1 hypothetical protein CFOUR_09445 [Corynebacterium fournieri]
MIKRSLALLTTAALALAPAANALPQRTYDETNPTTIGEHCAVPGDRGQTVEIVRSYFDGSAGTWTVSNYNDEPLPVTRSVTETKTKTWNVTAGLSFDVAKLIQFTFSTSYTDQQSYEVGEKIGPYNVAPGKTAVLQAGWIVSDFKGQETVCGTDGTWQAAGNTFTATMPKERHVRVSTRDNIDWGA